MRLAKQQLCNMYLYNIILYVVMRSIYILYFRYVGTDVLKYQGRAQDYILEMVLT